MKDERDNNGENTGENTGSQGCPESLKPYLWQKGQPSPNPGGRPRKAPVSDAYVQMIGERLSDDTRRSLKLPKGATWAHAMALGQLRSAIKGNTPAAKEIADRIEGRVTQPIAGEDGGPVAVRWIVEHIGGPKEPKE